MSSLPPTDLVFTITPGEESWTVVGPTPDSPPHSVSSPFADNGLLSQVTELREYSSVKLPPDDADLRHFASLAHKVSESITPLLFSVEARQAVRLRLNQVHFGRARLTVRVADAGSLGDQVLALPWEVVAPEPTELPVRQSMLEVVRESVVSEAPELPEPDGPLAVAVLIAAPEDQAGLSSEREEIRLQAALVALGNEVAFSDLGTVDDLAEVVALHHATAILFSGHGLPGHLLFENSLGFADPVAVEDVVRRLAIAAPYSGGRGANPVLFFLSACESASSDAGPSVAAALHRAGVPQVIGYFGSVRDSAASCAEESFFRSLARGDSALQAAHRARASLVDTIEFEGAPFVFPLAWTQLAIYHRGADRPLATGGRRVRRSLPARYRRRIEDRNGVPILTRGFVGRRAVQHEILRRVDAGARLIVLHGLGGSGKTALAGRLMTRRFATPQVPASTLLLRVPLPAETGDPILAVCVSAEDHGRKHDIPGWEEQVSEIRDRVAAPAKRFAAIVAALRDSLPRGRLVIYIDRVDNLQSGPYAGGEPGRWRPGAADWWREVEALAEEGVLVLASTRYLGVDPPSQEVVSIPPLSQSEAFRFTSLLDELEELAPERRYELADWSDGHPLTIERLEQVVEMERSIRGLGFDCSDPWSELVEPARSTATALTRREIRLDELWAGLPEKAKERARQIAESGVLLSSTEIEHPPEELGTLIRNGLLVRHLRMGRDDDDTCRWTEYWGLPGLLREVLAGPPWNL